MRPIFENPFHLFTPSQDKMLDTAVPELSVPVIDLSAVTADDRGENRVVEQIANACGDLGFFQVINHGIPQDLIQDYLEQCRRYFALPRAMKLRWKRSEENSRGYFAIQPRRVAHAIRISRRCLQRHAPLHFPSQEKP